MHPGEWLALKTDGEQDGMGKTEFTLQVTVTQKEACKEPAPAHLHSIGKTLHSQGHAGDHNSWSQQAVAQNASYISSGLLEKK